MSESYLTGSGETRMADEALCILVGRDLTENFPGYYWNIGANSDAGTIAISLAIPGDNANTTRGFLMHIRSVVGPDGQKKVRAAGGELLERWGLPRHRAPEDVIERALQHGLDMTNMVKKSRF